MGIFRFDNQWLKGTLEYRLEMKYSFNRLFNFYI